MRARPLIPVITLVALIGLPACGENLVSPTAPSAPGPSLAVSPGDGYELIRLGGEDSQAIDLNDAGVVVGVTSPDGYERAVYWTVDDAGTAAGPFELGIPAGEVEETWAIGVNDAGHAIAIVRAAPYRGFIYDVATDALTELSSPEGSIGVTPRSLNAGDVVTGNVWFDQEGETVTRAALWTKPFDTSVEPTLLPLPEGHVASSRCSLPVPLTDDGVIVGYTEAGDGTCELVRWELATDGSIGAPVVLGSAESSFFRWMNNAEQLAGWTRSAGYLQAVVRETDGSLVELDPVADDPQAVAVGINDPASGLPLLVAGTSDMWLDDEKAVVWSITDGIPSDPVVLPLGENGVSSRGSTVNAHGWVVGENTYTDPHPRRSGGRVAAIWVPGDGDDGGDGGGDDGDDCVQKGKNGNNCR